MRHIFILLSFFVVPSLFAGQPYTGLSPEDAVKAFKLPEGFHAALVAAEPDVVQPVAFEFDDRGRLWVAEFLSYPKWAPEGHDRIVLLEESTGTGRMNQRTVVWNKANYLTSFTLGFGGIWVTSPPNLYFLPCDFNADKPVVGEPQIILDGWSHAGTHNVVNNLTWGPDGWLYGCNGISSRSRVGPPGSTDAARVFIDGGIWRYHPVTKKLEQICTGMTNPWGMDWDERGELFCTNNVTAHLFHVIPGARFERSHEQDQNPYTYELMGGFADHKHYEGAWSDTKKGLKLADLGGGHSHVGAMIYKGKDWPEKYRNTIFMCNTHGNRINTDKLELTPNGYVAHHGEDFLLTNDKSFRGVSLKMGPDGALYVSDWHQDGECHSGSEVGSGRIYKIWYGEKKLVSFDALKVYAMGNSFHDSKEHSQMEKILDSNVWVHAHFMRLAHDHNPAPPQLQHEYMSPDKTDLRHLFYLIRLKTSIKKRLELYSYIPKSTWPNDAKKELILALVRKPVDADNRNNRLLLWYAIEPLLEDDPTWAFTVFRETKIPALRPFIARRMSEHKLPLVVEELAKTTDEDLQIDLLTGMAAALKGRFKVEEPPAWKAWYFNASIRHNVAILSIAQQIAAVFGDATSLDALRVIAEDKKSGLATRQNALQSLIDARFEKIVPLLQKLVRDLDMRRDAIRALGRFDDKQTPLLLLQLYPNFDSAEKADALATLAARPASATALLTALKNKTVLKSDLTAATANALQAHGVPEIDAWLAENWGIARTTAADKLNDIARLKKVVADATPKLMDAARGKVVFTKTCAGCHTLFGEGGKVGPDLTGSGRANLDYLLVNIVDPNAIVPLEYLAWTVKTTDGRVLNGLLRNERETGFDVVTATETISLRHEDVKSKKRGALSMMPDGLLNALKVSEILDLIAYLQGGGKN